MTARHAEYAMFAILIGALLSPILYVLITGDYPGARIFYGIQEDDPMVDALLTAHRFLTGH